MKYIVGCVAVEAIDTYVRVTVSNIGGIDAAARVAENRAVMRASVNERNA